jgi:hypothetical protein
MDFHVKFLSNNHFRFSVFSKEVGFHIYKLRRVISSSFDCYFHLWNNGTPHWEREKLAWELEQEKEWTEVRYKKPKKAISEPLKKVTFAKNLIQLSPPKKSPSVQYSPPQKIQFGAFSIPAVLPNRSLFGNTKLNSGSDVDRVFRNEQQAPCMQRQREISAPIIAAVVPDLSAQVSNSKISVTGPLCSRCLTLGHSSFNCPGKIRCWKCSNFGHTKKLCSSRSQSVWFWQQKGAHFKVGNPNTQASFRTRASPSLVWKPKIRIEDAADPNHQQEQPYNLLHPSQPPPPPQLPSPTKENPTSSLSLSGGAAVANFPVNPRPFLVAGL